jgi:hypothetical protein
MDTTYRCVNLANDHEVGKTAATPELAKLVAQYIDRSSRIGMEQTDWIDHFDKKKVHRSILIDAEKKPGEWELGIV